MNTEQTEQISNLNTNVNKTAYQILLAIGFAHLLNDVMQSLIPSIYPMIKDSFQLNFVQIGLITLTFQLSASILQPFVGFYTDKKPKPFSLTIGMIFTLSGIVLISFAATYEILLFAVALVGIGSSVFHPEASRVAHLASGGKRGTAQSIFQVGGNAGRSIGPLLAAIIIVPFGRSSIIWFSLLAILAIVILIKIGKWYKKINQDHAFGKSKSNNQEINHNFSKRKIFFTVSILLMLIFSKYIYLSGMTSFFTFYLIDKFQMSVQTSQVYLFIFLASAAIGTMIGGPLSDRFGRKYIIWFSILGVSPLTILLPYANLFWTTILTILIGVILASAFPTILVYAQELLPGKVGMIAGLFFGFAFGIAGIGSVVLGELADQTSINYVYQVCSFLPLIGLITWLLPNLETGRKSN